MQLRYSADPVRYAGMSTAELRENFLVDSLFRPDRVDMVLSDLDRAIVGSAVPVKKVLALEVVDDLKASYFTERREVGILNVGSRGSVEVDGKRFELDHTDCLYVGRGSKQVTFSSAQSHEPAAFYFLSYPAHTTLPAKVGRKAGAAATEIGSANEASKRTIYKYIHPDGIKSCQLVMGFTELSTGSVWNTMPAHTHSRRMEVYFYFDMIKDAKVIHLMGPPAETRHIVVADRQAVLSPGWSIHAGAGTASYSFCWGMGGENQAYTDMDPVSMDVLR